MQIVLFVGGFVLCCLWRVYALTHPKRKENNERERYFNKYWTGEMQNT